MALFHLNRKVIQRSAGKSVCKAFSYMHRTKVKDDFLGKTYSYPLKDNETVQSRVYIPEITPQAIKDSIGDLQNAENAAAKMAALVDKTENDCIDKRFRCPDARIHQKSRMQTGFTDVVALQKELSIDQNQAVLDEYIHTMYVSRGLLASSAIHFEDDNPHAHIFVSLRPVSAEGFIKHKDREVLKRSSLNASRETWAKLNNKMFERLNLPCRITNKSFKERGIELFPTIHEGDARFVRFAEEYVENNKTINEDIKKRNESKLKASPDAILKLMGSRYVKFKEQDLHQELSRYVPEKLRLIRQLTSQVLASEDLISLPSPQQEASPTYSTRTYIQTQSSLLQAASTLKTSTKHGLRDRTVSKIVKKEFSYLSEEQKDVAAALTSSEALHLVEGKAGTGKSTLLEAVARCYESQGYRVFGGAWSGAAADELGAKLNVTSKSLLSWFKTWESFETKINNPLHLKGFFRSGYFLDAYRQQLHHKSVFILDEASVVDTENLSYLLNRAASVGAKVIAVGDTYQNAPIGPGEAFRVLCDQYTPLSLNEIRRQKPQWMRAASVQLSQHNVADALVAYERHNRIQWLKTSECYTKPIQDFIQYAKDNGSQVILAAQNDDVMNINLQVHRQLQQKGDLGQSSQVFAVKHQKANVSLEFSQNDRILFHRNDYQGKFIKGTSGKRKGVTNGTLGTIAQLGPDRVIATLDDGRKVNFNPQEYPYFSHGYAMTIHKSQGKTFDRVYTLLNRPLDAETTYVALTRHREDCRLYVDQDKTPNLHRLIPTISRVKPYDLLPSSVDNTHQSRALSKAISDFEALHKQSIGLYKEASKSVANNSGCLFYDHPAFQQSQKLKPKLKQLSKALLEQWDSVRGCEHGASLNRYTLEILAGVRKKVYTNHELNWQNNKHVPHCTQPMKKEKIQKTHFDRKAVLDSIKKDDIPRLIEEYTPFVYNSRASHSRAFVFSGSGRGTSVHVSFKDEVPLAHNFEDGYGSDLIGFLAHYANKTYGAVCTELGEKYALEKVSVRKEQPKSFSKPQSMEQLIHKSIQAKKEEKKDDIARLQRYINVLEPAQGTAAETYLNSREIKKALPSDLKFHFSKKFGPSLVALARDHQSNVTAVQYIKLDPTTSRKITDGLAKISRGCVMGSSVLLQEDLHQKKTIFLAEGVETALSIREAGVQGEIRAVLGKSNFINVAATLPKSATIHIVADNDGKSWEQDPVIQRTVQFLKQQGRDPRVIFPEMSGLSKCDFNDVLQSPEGGHIIQWIVQDQCPTIMAGKSNALERAR